VAENCLQCRLHHLSGSFTAAKTKSKLPHSFNYNAWDEAKLKIVHDELRYG